MAALVAANVAAGRLITGPLRDLPAEHRLNHDLRARGGDRTTTLANALSRSSDTSRAITLGVGLTGLLLVRGRNVAPRPCPAWRWRWPSATHVTSSALVGRERPALERLGTHQPTSSFPSGHVGAMTALAVVLGRLAEPLPRPARVVARAALVAYLGALGWSRLYNGQHYASDVLAGYVNGVVAARLALHALDGGQVRMAEPPDDVHQLARADTPHGEIALRQRGARWSRTDRQRRVRHGFHRGDQRTRPRRRGRRPAGSGGGRRARAGLHRRPAAGQRCPLHVHVVELARPLIDWALAGVTEQLERVAHDPRVQLHHADIAEWLPRRDDSFDAILLDVDNGPGFLIHDHNARVYAADWLAGAVARLAPDGLLVIWSEGAAPQLAPALAELGELTERIVTVEREGRRFDYALYLLRAGSG